MPRSTRTIRGVAWVALTAVSLGAIATGAAFAQTVAEVQELTTPVVDIETETASLDRSLKRVERRADVQVNLAADVLFGFNKASLTGKARKRLRQVAAEIRAAGPGAVKVIGHTDSKGRDSSNLGLSRRRARSVEKALRMILGPKAPAFRVRGRGEADPVAANTRPDGSDNPKGRAENRRVEVRVPKPAR